LTSTHYRMVSLSQQYQLMHVYSFKVEI